jgi:hypothetical protein
MMQVYLQGLNKKKSEQLHKYLDIKLGRVANYYLNLLSKKKKRNLALPPLPESFYSPSSVATDTIKGADETVSKTEE